MFNLWVLLIIFLVPTVSGRSVQVLESYETYRECQERRDVVGYAMAEAYPEHDFNIVCEYRAKVI